MNSDKTLVSHSTCADAPLECGVLTGFRISQSCQHRYVEASGVRMRSHSIGWLVVERRAIASFKHCSCRWTQRANKKPVQERAYKARQVGYGPKNALTVIQNGSICLA